MIKLEKMTQHDYECFAGAETNDYMPDAFINYEGETLAGMDCTIILDAHGLGFHCYDHDDDELREDNYLLECSPLKALSVLERMELKAIDTDWLLRENAFVCY